MKREERAVEDGLGIFRILLILNELENMACEENDGHLTIMRFTTGWKVFLGTPDLDVGGDRELVYDIPEEMTFEEALRYALDCKPTLTCSGRMDEEEVNRIVESAILLDKIAKEKKKRRKRKNV